MKSAINLDFSCIEDLQSQMYRKLWPHAFDARSVILVMVSGGPDSMALLDRLNAYVKIHKKPFEVHAWHYNYEDDYSATEEKIVRDYCTLHGVPLYVEHCDRSTDLTFSSNYEANWRKLRYNAVNNFILSSIDNNVSPVMYLPVTAHTRDDVVETVLMNFVRNPASLIEDNRNPISRVQSEDLYFARPILSATKNSVYQHCRAFGIKYFQDPNNEDKNFLRSRIRAELIPLIQEMNPSFGRTLTSSNG